MAAGNARPGQPEGKRHREETARKGKGETVGQEPTASAATSAARQAPPGARPNRDRAGARPQGFSRPSDPGWPHEPAGDGGPRGMVAGGASRHRIRLTGHPRAGCSQRAERSTSCDITIFCGAFRKSQHLLTRVRLRLSAADRWECDNFSEKTATCGSACPCAICCALSHPIPLQLVSYCESASEAAAFSGRIETSAQVVPQKPIESHARPCYPMTHGRRRFTDKGSKTRSGTKGRFHTGPQPPERTKARREPE